MTMTTAFTAAPALPFIHPDDMPNIYAMKGVGTCMAPMLQDGDILAFDKREEPAVGDIVTLIFTREAAKRNECPGIVKRLVRALPPPSHLLPAGCYGLVFVEQINPPRSYTFRSSDVLAVHKFVSVATPHGAGMASVPRSAVQGEG